jgi:ketosteroid isomerase-like protein
LPGDAAATVAAFIAGINARDVDALAALMTDDHELVVFGEPPLRGRDANVEAWRGYVSSFPAYVISPHQVVDQGGGVVAVLGHTTGSHLGLSDDEERQQTLIWVGEVVDGKLGSWRLIEDTPEHRRSHGLAPENVGPSAGDVADA